MITIVDYGMGNLGSVANMLRKLRIAHRISGDPKLVAASEKLILPGVGSFAKGISNLKQLGLIDALNEAVLERKAPVLGICLGMQLLADHSEEGDCDGLGWIPGNVVRFEFDSGQTDGRFPLRVPHMGWKETRTVSLSKLFDVSEQSRFYFVHSYYLPAGLPETIAVAFHGVEFTAAVHSGNVHGVQFHPEKSHGYGMALLGRFAGI